MIHDDWPLWGDPGDLLAADPIGHVRRTMRAVLDTVWNALGIPPIDPAEIDKILEGL